MQTQVIEGTLADIQRQISKLPFRPNARLRVIATELEDSAPDEQLANAPRRNGLILFSTGGRHEPVTTAYVKDVLDED